MTQRKQIKQILNRYRIFGKKGECVNIRFFNIFPQNSTYLLWIFLLYCIKIGRRYLKKYF